MAYMVYRQKKRIRLKKEDTLTVSFSKNTLVINKHSRELLKVPARIELAYDKETNTIRIQATEENNGIELKKTKIYAKGFYKYFDFNEKGKYRAVYNGDKEALYVQIRPELKMK